MCDDPEFPTYKEYVGRYRILRHEELPDEHKAQYRLRGINPDEVYSLVWSFDDEMEAHKQLASCIKNALDYQTYFLKDAGASETIERSAWF